MPSDAEPPSPVSGMADSVPYDREDHYTQPGDLYRLLTEEERSNLIDNIVASMNSVAKEIQLRQIEHFRKADPEYGIRVATGLGLVDA